MPITFHNIFEKGDKYYIGYCLEIPGANGQGVTLDECRKSLNDAIELILQSRAEEARMGIPVDAIEEEIVLQ
ncbi:type II toxin-antitoxin system HicB family antitoxin [bacterium]|nr:type II toxin-antitoxin system HicB family antitoxin [bacterium]